MASLPLVSRRPKLQPVSGLTSVTHVMSPCRKRMLPGLIRRRSIDYRELNPFRSEMGECFLGDHRIAGRPCFSTKAPREIIKAVVGKNFVELPESDVCCGSAGSYNLTEPEMAERLRRRKTENILKTGAEVVVTTNPGCILQIRAGLKKAGANKIEVLHIADFLRRNQSVPDQARR